jgi:hypothetical protein
MEMNVGFMAQPFCPPEKETWYPLDERLGGPQTQSGHDEDKNLWLYWELNPSSPIIHPNPYID